ncbi:hypothetical protein ASF48_09265 [Rathayibacter sp. Leaf299]|uniref:cyclophilin-like fold protein n=1 Tax=unclassified Rathayibacter TaxID=2609250 RepID=UPI0006F7FF69|nr:MULTISPECIES: cyclophilin-like fold protein [unclassified Rathayibacter]KQQ20770.1 hypothetical protein ASF48_09265 [Rathayibacter sp. Leaf299]
MSVSASGPGRGSAVLACAASLLLSVSGCSVAGQGAESPSRTSTLSPTEAAPAATAPATPETTAPVTPERSSPAAEDHAGPASIALQFGDVVITGTVEDTAAGRSLLAQLPIELDFREYGGQEKIATLPAPLDLDGAPERAAAPAGTLGYYAPDQGLVLYYDDVGSYPGIVPLGTFGDVEALRDAAEGPVTVRRE